MYANFLENLEIIRSDYEDGDDVFDLEKEIETALVGMWTDDKAPSQMFLDEPELGAIWDRLFEEHSAMLTGTFWRGVDHAPFLSLRLGDMVDLSEFYSSWAMEGPTPKDPCSGATLNSPLETAATFTDPKEGVIFRFEGTFRAWDIRKWNPLENEVIFARGPNARFSVESETKIHVAKRGRTFRVLNLAKIPSSDD